MIDKSYGLSNSILLRSECHKRPNFWHWKASHALTYHPQIHRSLWSGVDHRQGHYRAFAIVPHKLGSPPLLHSLLVEISHFTQCQRNWSFLPHVRMAPDSLLLPPLLLVTNPMQTTYRANAAVFRNEGIHSLHLYWEQGLNPITHRRADQGRGAFSHIWRRTHLWLTFAAQIFEHSSWRLELSSLSVFSHYTRWFMKKTVCWMNSSFCDVSMSSLLEWSTRGSAAGHLKHRDPNTILCFLFLLYHQHPPFHLLLPTIPSVIVVMFPYFKYIILHIWVQSSLTVAFEFSREPHGCSRVNLSWPSALTIHIYRSYVAFYPSPAEEKPPPPSVEWAFGNGRDRPKEVSLTPFIAPHNIPKSESFNRNQVSKLWQMNTMLSAWPGKGIKMPRDHQLHDWLKNF